MSILDQILNRTNKAPVPVPTPEWPELDGRLFARRLTPAQRVAFYSVLRAQNPAPGIEFTALMAAYCTVVQSEGEISNPQSPIPNP